MSANRTFPESDFPALRAAGLIYADKSDLVGLIACDRKPKLLTRPPRFGKSLIVSMLNELFAQGVKPSAGHDCFKGLKIENIWWDHGGYPVLLLDFKALDEGGGSYADFAAALNAKLAESAAGLGLKLPADAMTPAKKLAAIAEKLLPMSLVLLADNYDAPLLKRLDDKKEIERLKLLYRRSLFSAIKTHTRALRCVFVTGTLGLSDLDLGSAGNSFIDISQDPIFSTLCGFTRDELRTAFKEELSKAVGLWEYKGAEQAEAEQIEVLLDELSAFCGGFCFDDAFEQQVFSPGAILDFFRDPAADLISHDENWVRQRFPKLWEKIRHQFEPADWKALLSGEVSASCMAVKSSGLLRDDYNPSVILMQLGLLTFKDSLRRRRHAVLGCPNQAARQDLAVLRCRT